MRRPFGFDRAMAWLFGGGALAFLVGAVLGLTLDGMTALERAAVVTTTTGAAAGYCWAAVKFWRLGRWT